MTKNKNNYKIYDKNLEEKIGDISETCAFVFHHSIEYDRAFKRFLIKLFARINVFNCF